MSFPRLLCQTASLEKLQRKQGFHTGILNPLMKFYIESFIPNDEREQTIIISTNSFALFIKFRQKIV